MITLLPFVALFTNQSSVAVTNEAAPVVSESEEARQKREKKERDRMERQKQLPAIIAAFSRFTSEDRANRLAYLCYETTIDTPLKPIDLAELALAETGGHALSAKAVSSEGALGVWQLMPQRARSHGYAPEEMQKDDKCAMAAVKELLVKLTVADGNIAKAKRLYCGAGKQARLYEAKTRKYRQVIISIMERQQQQPAYGI